MSKLTILAPAGSFAALVAAVQKGADAVYIGAKLFNARRLAGNFNREELQKAVQYAHLYNVKVYLTLNTLIKNSEIVPLLNQVSIAQQLGIDALIMQDLTFAPLIKTYFPEMEIHASTQATIMNAAAVTYWQKYVDQFVLARELTKKEVKEIYEKTKARLEVFVHGHLCISYSGQCLISSLIGERSGNRGMCASSCRKQYNGDQYLLSAKDLCMIRNMNDVVESGATTVKIEGRMKPAEYVAATTRAYREQIDALIRGREEVVSEEKMNELKLAFNREFTSGYFNDEKKIVDPTYSSKRGIYLGTVRNGVLQLEGDLEVHDGVGIIEKGNRVGDYVRAIYVHDERVSRAEKGQSIRLAMDGFKNGSKVYLMTRNKGQDPLSVSRKIPVSVLMTVNEGVEPNIKLITREKELDLTLPTMATTPQKHPMTAEVLTKELEKWRSEIFEWKEINVITDNSFIAKSAITIFRKELEQKLLDVLCPIKTEKQTISPPTYPKTENSEKKIHVRVYSLKGAREALEAGADVIYYDAFAEDLSEAMKLAGKKLFLHTPMVMVDKDIERLRKVVERTKPTGVMVNNAGVLGMGLNIPTVLGYQMNIFNDHQLQHYGHPAVASIELSLKELQGFQDKEKLIFYAHGYPAVMTFKETFDVSALTDKKEYTFRLRKTSTGATEMLYSKAIGTLQHTPEVMKAGITQLFLDTEKDVFALVSLYKKLLHGEAVSVKEFKFGVTIGNLVKGVM